MRRTQSVLGRFITSSRLSRLAQESAPVRELASAYVAGETVADAVAVARDLSGKGLELSFAYLGGCGRGPAGVVDNVRDLLEELEEPQGVELSISPDSIGLAQSPETARHTLEEVVDLASEHGASVTLGMEGHGHYRETLDLYRTVRPRSEHLGLTIPVDMRRAEKDVRDLAADAARVRLCIGSHPVPRALVLRKEHDKSLALVRCLRIMFESAGRPMVASHDPRIIAIAQELAHVNRREPSEFEFQMMHGVRPLEQRRLVDIGFTSRTYVPFGPAWYQYLAKRIAARPRTLWSYARAILDKR